MAGRQFPFPAPRKRSFFIPTGHPLFQASLQAGFPLFGVIVHCPVALLQLWRGIALFSGDGCPQLKVMTRNGTWKETWTGGSPACLPRCLQWARCSSSAKTEAERQKGSLGPASFASFRTASPPVLRPDAVSNHPPPTADTGARSPVLRRQTDSTLPAGHGVARPLCDQTPSSEPNQSLSTNNLPPVKPQRRTPTFDAAPCDVSAVARRLQPDPTPPPSCAAGGMRRKSPS